jgi:hypothetical protein
MSYCRFRNTLGDLRDCRDSLREPIDNREEREARIDLVMLCKEILDRLGFNVVVDGTDDEEATEETVKAAFAYPDDDEDDRPMEERP